MDNQETTYIYDNIEVKKTNRYAQKTLASGKVDILYEITPLHQTTGTWKKWIREGELFIIEKKDDDELS